MVLLVVGGCARPSGSDPPAECGKESFIHSVNIDSIHTSHYDSAQPGHAESDAVTVTRNAFAGRLGGRVWVRLFLCVFELLRRVLGPAR
jgi:hypothetical protein